MVATMRDTGIEPDLVTYNTLIHACAKDWTKAQQVFEVPPALLQLPRLHCRKPPHLTRFWRASSSLIFLIPAA